MIHPDPITFATVCSGIEAPSEAWCPLGWKPLFYSEIEAGPIAVLKHRHAAHDVRAGRSLAAGVPLFADFSGIRIRHLRRLGIAMPDVLIGGTPCQSFSVAGKRLSLGDDRGNLALAFVRLAHAIDAVRESEGKPGLVVVWENVTGVLSTDDNAFGCLLGGFIGADHAVIPCQKPRDGKSNEFWKWREEEKGGGFHAASWPDFGMASGPRARAAWGIRDAQYFGLAQRRERVFLVVSFRDGADPAEILFERRGVHGNSPPSREAGQRPAASLTASTGGISEKDDIAGRIIAEQRTAVDPLDVFGVSGRERGPDVAPADALRVVRSGDEREDAAGVVRHGLPDVAWALQERDRKGPDSSTKEGHLIVEAMPILEAGARTGNSTTDPRAGMGIGEPGDPMFTLQRGKQHAVAFSCKDDGRDATEELAPTMRAMNFHKSHMNGGGQLAVAIDLRNGVISENVTQTLQSAGLGTERGSNPNAIPHTFAFKPSHYTRDKDGAPSEIVPPLTADADKGDQDPLICQTHTGWTNVVRRLLPTECEILQGYYQGYTLVPFRGGWLSDSARYAALGNSMAVPVIRWLGIRIEAAMHWRVAA